MSDVCTTGRLPRQLGAIAALVAGVLSASPDALGDTKSIPVSGTQLRLFDAEPNEATLLLTLKNAGVDRRKLVKALKLRLPDLSLRWAGDRKDETIPKKHLQLTIVEAFGDEDQLRIELQLPQGERFGTVLNIDTTDRVEQVARAAASLIISVQGDDRKSSAEVDQGSVTKGGSGEPTSSPESASQTEEFGVAARVDPSPRQTQAKQTREGRSIDNKSVPDQATGKGNTPRNRPSQATRAERKRIKAELRRAAQQRREEERTSRAAERRQARARRTRAKRGKENPARGLLEIAGISAWMLSASDESGRRRAFAGIGPGLRMGLKPRSAVPITLLLGIDFQRSRAQEAPATLDRLRTSVGLGYHWNWSEHWQLRILGTGHIELWRVNAPARSWSRQRTRAQGPSLGGALELGVFWRSAVIRRAQAQIRWRIGPEFGAAGGGLIGRERTAPSLGVNLRRLDGDDTTISRLGQVGGAELRIRLVAGMTWGRRAHKR